MRSPASRSICVLARFTRWWARTALESRRSSASCPATRGRIAAGFLVQGQEVQFQSPKDARRCGIATIFQEPMVVPGLSVAENVVLGSEPTVGWGWQVYSRRRAERIAAGGGAKSGPCRRHRPACAHGRALHGAKADRRDRACADSQRTGYRVGRADRGPFGRGGEGAFAHAGPAAREGHRDPLRLASAQRGARPRRPDHGPARRPPHRDAARGRGYGDSAAHRADARAAARRIVPASQ